MVNFADVLYINTVADGTMNLLRNIVSSAFQIRFLHDDSVTS